MRHPVVFIKYYYFENRQGVQLTMFMIDKIKRKFLSEILFTGIFIRIHNKMFEYYLTIYSIFNHMRKTNEKILPIYS